MKTLIIRVILTFILCYITVGFVTWNWIWITEQTTGYVVVKIITVILMFIVAFANVCCLNSNR